MKRSTHASRQQIIDVILDNITPRYAKVFKHPELVNTKTLHNGVGRDFLGLVTELGFVKDFVYTVFPFTEEELRKFQVRSEEVRVHIRHLSMVDLTRLTRSENSPRYPWYLISEKKKQKLKIELEKRISARDETEVQKDWVKDQHDALVRQRVKQNFEFSGMAAEDQVVVVPMLPHSTPDFPNPSLRVSVDQVPAIAPFLLMCVEVGRRQGKLVAHPTDSEKGLIALTPVVPLRDGMKDDVFGMSKPDQALLVKRELADNKGTKFELEYSTRAMFLGPQPPNVRNLAHVVEHEEHYLERLKDRVSCVVKGIAELERRRESMLEGIKVISRNIQTHKSLLERKTEIVKTLGQHELGLDATVESLIKAAQEKGTEESVAALSTVFDSMKAAVDIVDSEYVKLRKDAWQERHLAKKSAIEELEVVMAEEVGSPVSIVPVPVPVFLQRNGNGKVDFPKGDDLLEKVWKSQNLREMSQTPKDFFAIDSNDTVQLAIKLKETQREELKRFTSVMLWEVCVIMFYQDYPNDLSNLIMKWQRMIHEGKISNPLEKGNGVKTCPNEKAELCWGPYRCRWIGLEMHFFQMSVQKEDVGNKLQPRFTEVLDSPVRADKVLTVLVRDLPDHYYVRVTQGIPSMWFHMYSHNEQRSITCLSGKNALAVRGHSMIPIPEGWGAFRMEGPISDRLIWVSVYTEQGLLSTRPLASSRSASDKKMAKTLSALLGAEKKRVQHSDIAYTDGMRLNVLGKDFVPDLT